MTAVNVKGIPEDLAKFILKIQGDIKAKKGTGTYSQGQAILHIIREYKVLINK